MADTVDSLTRSQIMAKVPRFNTKPELLLRCALHMLGHRFRLHRADLPGRPDLVLARYRAAIFVHGCFWHRHPGCQRTTSPTDRAEFWQRKFAQNQQRDQRARQALLADGWRVAIIWECSLRRDALAVSKTVSSWIRSEETEFEFPLNTMNESS